MFLQAEFPSNSVKALKEPPQPLQSSTDTTASSYHLTSDSPRKGRAAFRPPFSLSDASTYPTEYDRTYCSYRQNNIDCLWSPYV